MALITCKEAAFAYDGGVVVSGLNFVINSGDYICIVGENGSGKSTLVKGILGLKSPKSGSIGFDKSLYLTEIGYLPQQTVAQKDFPASAYEIVLSGRLSSRGLAPFYSKEDKRIALENLRRLDIYYLRSKCYRELSGGQQQRVLLARALCSSKKVLLLDEPVSGLDPLVTQDFYRLIEHINKETGIAVIMVSHDIHSAVKYASHILHLKNTQIFFGKTEDYTKSKVGHRFLQGEEND
jgi:zinc transport system ATP-binding protein